MPAGLTLSADGRLSGTPTAGGVYPGAITATNSEGATTASFGITVRQAPVFTTDNFTASLSTNTSYQATLTATGTPTPTYAVTSGTLPPGLTLEASGALIGLPTTAGTFTGVFTAANSAGSATQTFTFTVTPSSIAPTFTNAPFTRDALAANFAVGDAVDLTLASTGAPAPSFGVTAGALPPGLTLSTAGALAGTPTTPGVFTGTFTSTNSAGSATQAFTFIVYATALPASGLTVSSVGAQFPADNPSGLAVGPDDRVYFSSNGGIYQLNADNSVTRLAGNYGSAYIDGAGTTARFSSPDGLAVDASRRIYVADSSNHRIRVVSADNVVSTVAGNGTAGFADGPAASAQFNLPRGVALDAAGNVYVADYQNQRIRKIAPDGTVTTVAGAGDASFAGRNGEALSAGLYYPSRVWVNAAGTELVILESLGGRLRRVVDGEMTTLAGSGFGSADGTGTAAQFNQPRGFTRDNTGNFYVADSGNNRIRKVTPEGVVTTVAGGASGYADGPGASAQFNFPSDIALTSSGTFFITDSNNRRLRSLSAAGLPAPVFANSPLVQNAPHRHRLHRPTDRRRHPRADVRRAVRRLAAGPDAHRQRRPHRHADHRGHLHGHFPRE